MQVEILVLQQYLRLYMYHYDGNLLLFGKKQSQNFGISFDYLVSL